MESTTAVARTVKPAAPFFDLQAQFATIRREILQAVSQSSKANNSSWGSKWSFSSKKLLPTSRLPSRLGAGQERTRSIWRFVPRPWAGRRSDYQSFTFVATAGPSLAPERTRICRYRTGHVQYRA